mgnify:CR=1 FL=1
MRSAYSISFLSLILISYCLIGCGGLTKKKIEDPPIPTKDWAEIKEDSVITILAENSPVSYFIYRGRNMGYEYELLYEFSKDQNIRIQIQMVNNQFMEIHFRFLDNSSLIIDQESNRLFKTIKKYLQRTQQTRQMIMKRLRFK